MSSDEKKREIAMKGVEAKEGRKKDGEEKGT
jgi:hypothetical protein